MGEPPKVTGLSPVEGPPGTKVTIRGENLGLDQNDLLSVTICGVDCSMYSEWKSSSKIVTRTRVCTGRGEVVVTTRSGGVGTCTVNFRGILEVIGPTVESAIWVDESHMFSDVFGRKGHPASPAQLHPEDPLGISDESVKRFPEEELRQLFPEGSGNLLSENFNPACYLLENYNSTSFSDLKAGLQSLKRKVGQLQEGPSSFLKSNVNSIVVCLDVLHELQKAMEKDKQEMGSDLTEKLYEAVTRSKNEAENIFESILARKDQADSTRNALGILQKFRFLFNLPVTIEKNIQKGDYDIVINDYNRAKSLFQDTEVAVFRRVFNDVEQRVQRFRNSLMDSLKQLPMPVDEQKRLIRYLISLEVPGSPAWDAVRYNYSWLYNSVINCKQKHIASLATDSEDEQLVKSQDESQPKQVLFVEEVTKLFKEHLCDFWKLSQAYFAGDLFVSENVPVNPKDEKDFKDMLGRLVAKLCWEVRVALLPPSHHSLAGVTLGEESEGFKSIWPGHTQGERLGPWLPQCLRCIRKCYLSLLKLEIPEEYTALVQQLIFDLRVHSMSCLFGQAAEDVRNLLKSEVWRLEQDDRCGGTTQLVFEQINVQGAIKQLAQGVLLAFVETLEKCALSPDRLSPMIDSIGSPVEITPPGQRARNWKQKREDSLTTPPLEKRLLIVLSNCSFTSRVAIPRLQESFKRHGYPDMSPVIKIVQSRLMELDNKLFLKLLEAKCDPIVGAIEPSMYAGAFDWKRCPEPIGVSPYIKEVLMNLIEVHAEVYTVSPPLVGRIMTPLVQFVAEEVARIYECTDKFTKYGNMQVDDLKSRVRLLLYWATLDLRALEEAVDFYRNQSTGNHFMICRNKLDPFGSTREKELVDELLKKFRAQMRIQLLCFKEDVVVSV
ncbi:exocyst complex component secretory 5 isoform X5 [Rhipicephalus microplus]|uniref:exocyst complex component secretory 5 isoform X5 n=1 Tax=Rhipicephalus microplus TaxID=6941 RepID=UPI003F6D7A2D